MNIEHERLHSLIEFAQQSARLRTTPAATISQHAVFALYEHQLQGLPGINLNVNPNGDDEIWLTVERRHETNPPEINDPLLRPWVEIAQGPMGPPQLKTTLDGGALIAAGTHRSSLKSNLSQEEARLPAIDPRKTVLLEDYEGTVAVHARFKEVVPPLVETRKRK